MTVELKPGQTTLPQLEHIWRSGEAAILHADARPQIEKAAELVARAAAGTDAVYGVNTGFGKLASVKIAAGDTAKLQRNLILSHCCGVGEALDREHDAADDGAEASVAGSGGFRHALGRDRTDSEHAGRWRDAGHSRPGVGRCVRRSGTACPYGRRDDGGG